MFKRTNETQQLKNLSADQQNKNTTDIFSAVQSNDLEKIRCFIDQGIDVNTHDKRGLAPLHYVTSKEALDLLVEKQADVHIKSLNIRNISGFVPFTPLSSACSYGKYPLIVPILQHYSLSDFENKPEYVKKEKFLSLIWDFIYQGKKDFQTLSLPTIQQQKDLTYDELITIELRPEDLFTAIRTNDLERFKQLLSQEGASIHVCEGKNTLLSSAISRHGYPFLTPIFLHSSSNLKEEPPDYIKKNNLAFSLWEACKHIKSPLRVIGDSAIPIETRESYRKKNQFFADLWEKHKQNCQSSAGDLTKEDVLIQDFHLF